MPSSLLKPTLYTPSDDPDGVPVLLGGRCAGCGYTFFPMQTFGCERCGAVGAALQPLRLRGCGTLEAVATVHLHHDSRRPTPYVVGTIALDDGPVVRTLLVDARGATLADGAARGGERVVAVLVAVAGSEGEEALDLRFRVEPAAEGAAG